MHKVFRWLNRVRMPYIFRVPTMCSFPAYLCPEHGVDYIGDRCAGNENKKFRPRLCTDWLMCKYIWWHFFVVSSAQLWRVLGARNLGIAVVSDKIKSLGFVILRFGLHDEPFSMWANSPSNRSMSLNKHTKHTSLWIFIFSRTGRVLTVKAKATVIFYPVTFFRICFSTAANGLRKVAGFSSPLNRLSLTYGTNFGVFLCVFCFPQEIHVHFRMHSLTPFEHKHPSPKKGCKSFKWFAECGEWQRANGETSRSSVLFPSAHSHA